MKLSRTFHLLGECVLPDEFDSNLTAHSKRWIISDETENKLN